MVGNQFTQPIDLADSESAKRLLIDLSSSLGLVIAEADVEVTSLSSLQASINELNEVAIVNEDSPTLVESDTLKHKALAPSVYKDFNNAAWGTLKGNGQFTELGSNLVNTPFTPVGGTQYIFYIESNRTLGGGVVQRLLTEISGVSLTAHYRTGNTFALAVSNGWTTL